MSFAENLKTIRKKRNITQEQVADILGVSRQAVSKWESGTTMPDVMLIPAIASFFGVSTDELFDFNLVEQERRVAELCAEAAKYRFSDPAKSEKMLRDGLKQYPGNDIILNNLLYTISDIERIGDHALNLAEAAKEMNEKKINFSDAAKAELLVLEQAVLDMLAKVANAFEYTDLAKAMKVEPHEEVIDALVREVKSRHVRRLRDGKCTVEYGFVLDDLLTSYERIADHCSNMAVEMLQSAEDKMEIHEYLNALRAGELDESVKYNQRIGMYTERYQFPEEA